MQNILYYTSDNTLVWYFGTVNLRSRLSLTMTTHSLHHTAAVRLQNTTPQRFNFSLLCYLKVVFCDLSQRQNFFYCKKIIGRIYYAICKTYDMHISWMKEHSVNTMSIHVLNYDTRKSPLFAFICSLSSLNRNSGKIINKGEIKLNYIWTVQSFYNLK